MKFHYKIINDHKLITFELIIKCYQITSQPVNQTICILLLYQLYSVILFQ